jgi:hypothetical protein
MNGTAILVLLLSAAGEQLASSYPSIFSLELPVATPYQPLDARGGYTDVQLTGAPRESERNGRWLIAFRGNALTLPEDALAMAHRRAAQICAPEDYETLGEKDISATETEADRAACVARYGVPHCDQERGESMPGVRWEITVVCQARGHFTCRREAPRNCERISMDESGRVRDEWFKSRNNPNFTTQIGHCFTSSSILMDFRDLPSERWEENIRWTTDTLEQCSPTPAECSVNRDRFWRQIRSWRDRTKTDLAWFWAHVRSQRDELKSTFFGTTALGDPPVYTACYREELKDGR